MRLLKDFFSGTRAAAGAGSARLTRQETDTGHTRERAQLFVKEKKVKASQMYSRRRGNGNEEIDSAAIGASICSPSSSASSRSQQNADTTATQYHTHQSVGEPESDMQFSERSNALEPRRSAVLTRDGAFVLEEAIKTPHTRTSTTPRGSPGGYDSGVDLPAHSSVPPWQACHAAIEGIQSLHDFDLDMDTASKMQGGLGPLDSSTASASNGAPRPHSAPRRLSEPRASPRQGAGGHIQSPLSSLTLRAREWCEEGGVALSQPSPRVSWPLEMSDASGPVSSSFAPTTIYEQNSQEVTVSTTAGANLPSPRASSMPSPSIRPCSPDAQVNKASAPT